jgi:hypothetical protein
MIPNRVAVKNIFVITPVTEGLLPGRRPYEGPNRRQTQRRMGIGRRTGQTRRATVPPEGLEFNPKRTVPDRRATSDRRKRTDRRIGVRIDFDLADLDL